MRDPDRDPHRLEFVDPVRCRWSEDGASFDRVEFARDLFRQLRPRNMTAAIYGRQGDLFVERARDLRRGPEAVWATVGIPLRASRAEIALAMAELAGVDHLPYVIDLLARSGAEQHDIAIGPQRPAARSSRSGLVGRRDVHDLAETEGAPDLR